MRGCEPRTPRHRWTLEVVLEATHMARSHPLLVDCELMCLEEYNVYLSASPCCRGVGGWVSPGLEDIVLPLPSKDLHCSLSLPGVGCV